MSRQSLGLSLGHRRLRFSFQINDFKDPGTGEPIPPFSARLRRRRRCSRLAFPCQAVIPKKNLFSAARPEAMEALFSASFSCVKWFFLKKNLCLQTTLEGRRRRLSKEGRSPCQPGFFSHFAEQEDRSLQAAKNRLESPRGSPLFRPTIRLERGT